MILANAIVIGLAIYFEPSIAKRFDIHGYRLFLLEAAALLFVLTVADLFLGKISRLISSRPRQPS